MPDTESTDEQVLLGAKAPKSPAVPQLDTTSILNPIAQVAKDLSIGEQEVQNNQHNVWLMSQNMDDSQRMNSIKAGITKIQGGTTQADQEAQPWYQALFHNVVQSAPSLGDMGAQGVAGGTIGAGAGATIGSVVPGIGTAIGAGAGWGWGFSTGMFKSGWEQSAGEMYGSLREAGVDHDTSKNISYAVGAVNGALNTIGGKILTSIAGKAVTQTEKRLIIKAATSTFVEQLEKNMLGRMAMNVTIGTLEQTAIGTGTSIMEEAGKVVAGILQKQNPEAFTDFGSSMKHIREAFTSSLMAGPVLATGAHVAGQAIGNVTGKTKLALDRTQLNKIKNISPHEILKQVQGHLEDMPNPWETGETSVAHDEAGQVYIRTGTTKTGQLQLTDIIENPQSKIQKELQVIYPEEKTLTPEEIAEGKQLRLALQTERNLNPTEVKGRLNQIASDIKTLKKEERRLEAEITIKEGTGQSSQKLIDKWRNVTHAIDALESKRDFIEKGLGTNITENAENVKLKMNTLNKVFDNLTATAERLQRTKEQLAQTYEIGFKRGKYETERGIRKIQAELVHIVNASTEDPKIRATVKQYINKVTNPAQALKAIASIKENIIKQESAKAAQLNEVDRLKTFNAVVKLAQNNRVTLQSGYPVTQLPQEIVTKLQVLKGFLKDKKSLDAFLEQTALEHGNKSVSELPEDVAFKAQLATMADALHNGDALTRNVTAANIAQWVYDGEKIITAKKAELQLKKDTAITTAKNSLGYQKGQIKYLTSQIDQIRHSINDIGAQGFTWNTLLDLITPKDKNHQLSKILDESESRHNYLASVKTTNLNMVKGIEGYMKNNGYEGNLIQKVWNDNNVEVRITSEDKNGNLFTLEPMTRGQMIDVALKAKDPSLHKALREGNGFTLPGDTEPGTSTLERINEALTKDDQAQIEATLAFYKDYHGSVNEVYKNKYGADLPMRDNYSPVTRKGYKVDAPYSQQGLQFSNLLPGSANTRMDSKLPIQFHNPMEDTVSHIRQWEYFKNYTDLLDRVGHTLTDSDIRTHIRDNFGAGTLKVLDDFHKRFIQNSPVPSAPGNSWWSAMRSDFSNAVMGFRANQFFTILPHGLNTWANYSATDILHGIKETVLHPLETDKVLKQSPIFEARTREGTNFELESAMHHSGLFGNTIGKIFGIEPTLEDQRVNSTIKRFIYAAHIGADVGIQRIFGAPIYHAELKNGATPHQALIAAERAIEQTQPGHSVSQTPFIQTNPIAHTMLAQYTQHPSQVLGKSLVAVRDWQHNMNDPKAWMKLGGALGALWAIPGALTATARVAPLLINNPNQDEDTLKEAGYQIAGGAIMGPLESEPIIGDIVQGIWFHSAKHLIGVDESKMGELHPSTFVSEIYNNTTTALKRWAKLGEPQDPTKLEDVEKEEDSKIKAELSTTKAASMALGIPNQLTSGPITAARQAEKGDILGAGFALGGWSPGMLAKRIPPSMEESLRLEEKRIEDSIKGGKDESVYDTMKTYLQSLFHGQEPPKPDTETSPAVKAFMEESSK
jgi:hypothetical protein